MGTLVRNAAKLRTSKAASDALDVIVAGMSAASPASRLYAHITNNTLRLGSRSVRLGSYRRVCVLAYGKAAGAMAQAAEQGAQISDGIIVIPEGTPGPRLGSKYTVLHSSHPIPSAKSLRAAKAIVERIESLGPDDYAIFLVSGGGSAMLALPLNVRLADKVRVNNLLLKTNASIKEINCVRRRLSKIKGGGLVSRLCCSGAALLMSDVQGDKPYDIASGCTQTDPTTFADALKVLQKYNLTNKVPPRVIAALKAGKSSESNNKVRKKRIANQVIATNANCVCAMTKTARALGYRVRVESSYGAIDNVARRIVSKMDKRPMSCVVFGGEPTVRVRGRGKGGRNQELVARILMRIGDSGMVAASVGTDGIDGNTQAAGALAESATISSPEIASRLRNSDSNALFARHGRLVMTGHTGTNLQDVGVLIRGD